MFITKRDNIKPSHFQTESGRTPSVDWRGRGLVWGGGGVFLLQVNLVGEFVPEESSAVQVETKVRHLIRLNGYSDSKQHAQLWRAKSLPLADCVTLLSEKTLGWQKQTWRMFSSRVLACCPPASAVANSCKDRDRISTQTAVLKSYCPVY